MSAWTTTYLIRERHAAEASSRYMLSGLWAGIAAGRVVLAWLLDSRLGEKTFAIVMLGMASVCAAVIWSVKNANVSAVAVAGVGFFIG